MSNVECRASSRFKMYTENIRQSECRMSNVEPARDSNFECWMSNVDCRISSQLHTTKLVYQLNDLDWKPEFKNHFI